MSVFYFILRDYWKQSDWFVKLSTLFLLFVLILAVFAPVLSSHAFDLQNLELTFASPSWDHFFGTDALGRDLWSRMLYGSRLSLSIAFVTAMSSVGIGLLYGLIAGYLENTFSRWMMGLVDVLYTLPTLMVSLLVMLLFGRDMKGLLIAMVITGWLGTARLVEVQVRSLKRRPFMEATDALGFRAPRKLLKHILPNCAGPLLVELSYQIPTNVLSEAFLSFLGVGVRPPNPSWGVLADEGWRTMQYYPHLIIFPGLIISLTMLSFNFIGDSLRDFLDPHLKGRL
jgi:oligopeptide transport system permease protein